MSIDLSQDSIFAYGPKAGFMRDVEVLSKAKECRFVLTTYTDVMQSHQKTLEESLKTVYTNIQNVRSSSQKIKGNIVASIDDMIALLQSRKQELITSVDAEEATLLNIFDQKSNEVEQVLQGIKGNNEMIKNLQVLKDDSAIIAEYNNIRTSLEQNDKNIAFIAQEVDKFTKECPSELFSALDTTDLKTQINMFGLVGRPQPPYFLPSVSSAQATQATISFEPLIIPALTQPPGALAHLSQLALSAMSADQFSSSQKALSVFPLVAPEEAAGIFNKVASVAAIQNTITTPTTIANPSITTSSTTTLPASTSVTSSFETSPFVFATPAVPPPASTSASTLTHPLSSPSHRATHKHSLLSSAATIKALAEAVDTTSKHKTSIDVASAAPVALSPQRAGMLTYPHAEGSVIPTAGSVSVLQEQSLPASASIARMAVSAHASHANTLVERAMKLASSPYVPSTAQIPLPTLPVLYDIAWCQPGSAFEQQILSLGPLDPVPDTLHGIHCTKCNISAHNLENHGKGVRDSRSDGPIDTYQGNAKDIQASFDPSQPLSTGTTTHTSIINGTSSKLSSLRRATTARVTCHRVDNYTTLPEPSPISSASRVPSAPLSRRNTASLLRPTSRVSARPTTASVGDALIAPVPLCRCSHVSARQADENYIEKYRSTSVTITGLRTGTTYHVYIAAVGQWGRSKWSAPLQVTTGSYATNASMDYMDKLVVLGGNNTENNDNSATNATNLVEIFTPFTGLTGSWSVLPRLHVPVIGAAAAMLRDRIVVVGGFNTGTNNSPESSNTDTSSSYPSRTTHPAPVASCHVLDMISHTWHALCPMHEPRRWHAVTVNGDNLLVTGGFDGHGRLASAERYDVTQDEWVSVSNMLQCRDGHTATALPTGHVLVAGGYDGYARLSTAEMYDTHQDTWTWVAPLITPREAHAAVYYEGAVIVAGGYDGQQYLSSIEIYLPTYNIWVRGPQMTTPRSHHCMQIVYNCTRPHIVISGGSNGQHNLRSVEILELPTPAELDDMAAIARGFISPALTTTIVSNLTTIETSVDFTLDPHAYALAAALVNTQWKSLLSSVTPRSGATSVALPPRADLPVGVTTWAEIADARKDAARRRRRQMRDEY